MSFDLLFGLIYFGGGIAIGVGVSFAVYALRHRPPERLGILAGAIVGLVVGAMAGGFFAGYCAWGGC